MLTVLSWNGSMFEYLMPALLMRSAPGQLLGQSESAAVKIQKRYGDRLGLPWGVSEAAFAARDAAHRYQYRAFGVVGLGMKQGLAEDYVVAPYASALALAVRPRAALENLRRLEKMGLMGRYGFYDSVDFTASRVADARGYTVVRTFMAHHQGMLLAAIDNALCDDILVKRFGRNRLVSAVDLLLHERVPWEYIPEPLPDTGPVQPAPEGRRVPRLQGWPISRADVPQLHAFGNGRLSVRINEAAGGTLWWRAQALTHWNSDRIRNADAAGIVLRDAEDGETWDFGNRPERPVDVTFHPEMASFHLVHLGIAATQDIVVAAADDVEIRRMTLLNHSERDRVIELTACAVPVLAPALAHERHPAFSKLFVHSEHLPGLNGLLFTRRPRRSGDAPPVMLHRLLAEDEAVHFAGFESDRRTFVGRHGDPGRPAGLDRVMSGAAGWTLDPVSALRAQVRLPPGARAQLAFLTIAAGSRETALEIAERYSNASALDWAFEDASRSTDLEVDRLGASQAEMQASQQIAGRLQQPRFGAAPPPHEQQPGQPDLWELGLSGDHPIVLIQVADADHAALLPAAVRAHRWWRRNGLQTDLVILGTAASSYEEPIAARLRDALREAGLAEGLGGDGGVHLHSADRIAPAKRRALEVLACLVLDGSAKTLPDALPPALEAPIEPPYFETSGAPGPMPTMALKRPDDLLFDNGLGGFSPDARSYVIHLERGGSTPVPWCNVLANETFGSIVSEAGLGFTWSENSGEHRLTPWSNDPVTDAQGEALYLRDEETAEVWTPTPLPAGDGATCQITHAAGNTVWARNSHGLKQQLTVFVPSGAPVKLARLELSNDTHRPRRITATYVAEWQLGALPSKARSHVSCGFHAAARALIARNGWAPEFADRIAFLTASRPAHSLTCDRAAFLGTGGPVRPEGLQRWNLDGRTEAVADPCGAYQVHLDLAPGAVEDVVFVLGDAADMAEMEELAAEWSDPGRVVAALQETAEVWDRRLGAIRVETPDPAFDLMVNRWLPYQALSSRILARAGFHQAGGGIGFRDQLQDMMALVVSDPDRVRAHILDCAAHQFEEGDVLHWWHPPEGRGVRTRCSDDMMWLVYATHRYVSATGDSSILDEQVPFLAAAPLAEDEDDRYAAFGHGTQSETLYEHCARAMERGATSGAHGLPLIGAGDWNDGMDRVGYHGRGESVWLAWFAALCGDGFAELSELKNRQDRADLWRQRAKDMRNSVEASAWDGAWYIRAFDDSGEAWGSSENDECRIDSIAQSWSVLARAPDTARARQAIRSAADRLIDIDKRLVRLLTPPFDRTPRDPGYIRAYPPGVRENGGQYTHAATWLGFAFAQIGDGDAAYDIFDLINPVRRSATPEDAELYRGEPYVMPADVGGSPPFERRAGWTWYTGAAAWAWRLGTEGILGLELRGGRLHIAPSLPKIWGGYRAIVRSERGTIDLEVLDPDATGGGRAVLDVDGQSVQDASVAFPTDGSTRRVRATLKAHPSGLKKAAAKQP